LVSTSVPALTILYHPDLSRVGERSWLNDPGGGERVRLSRAYPAFIAAGSTTPAPLRDPHLSRHPVWLQPHANGRMTITVDRDATATRIDGDTLIGRQELDHDMLERGIVIELAKRVVLLLHHVALREPKETDDLDLVGSSSAMHAVRRQIRKVASHDVPVLIRGESGTGKELVAAAIHRASRRADGPFVAVNMAALVPSTAASALFGHTVGSFTGATSASDGFFGAADGGTLFLDEIADTPAEIQPALLRALDSGEVQPLGSGNAVKRDVRLVAATDADLEGLVARGHFRLPLLQRLAGYPISLPALRQRRQDIPVLLLHFLQQHLAAVDKLDRLEHGDKPWLPAPLVSWAALAPWPGNVRELRNLAQRLVIDWCEAPRIEMFDGIARHDAVSPEKETAEPREASVSSGRRRLRDISEDEVVKALREHEYRPGPAAEMLGIARSSLYALIDSSNQIRKAAELETRTITEQLADCGGDVRAAAIALEVSERGLRLRMRQLDIDS